MCFINKIAPVILASFLMMSWSCIASPRVHAAQGTIQENRKRLIETNSCPGCDLSGVDLNRVNLPGANLEGANLTQAKLYLATLTRANFHNAILRGAEFSGSDLADADLRGADLRGADFTGAYLVGAQLDPKAIADPSSGHVVSGADSLQAVLSGREKNDGATPSEESGFFDRTLEGVMGLFGLGNDDEKIARNDKTEQTGKADEKVQQDSGRGQRNLAVENGTPGSVVQDVPPADESATELSAGVVEKDLRTDDKDVMTEHANQAEDLVKSDRMNRMASFPERVNVPDAAADAEQNRQRLLDTKKCYGCILTGVDLSDKNLAGADLESADLTGSRLTGANLENANMKGAILVGADLKNAKLHGADLYKANLSRADLTGARLDGAFLDDVQVAGTIGYE